MENSWKNLCGLCGSCKTFLKFEPSREKEEILSRFSIDYNELKICEECSNFLVEIHIFINKCYKVQEMLRELQNCDNQNLFDFKEVIIKFGLDLIEKPFPDFTNDNLEDVTIKVESQLEESNGHNFDSIFSDKDDDFPAIETESEKNLDTSCSQNQSVKVKREQMEMTIFDFSCRLCPKTFTKFETLRKHVLSIHKTLPKVTCICGKEYSNRKRLLEHKRVHYPDIIAYECKECKKKYLIKSAYEAHLKDKHSPDAKKFICSECGKIYSTQSELRFHEKQHLPPELKLLYSCDICAKQFASKFALRTHFASVHLKIFAFTCEKCGKSYSTKGGLKDHLNTHNSRSIQCGDCDKCFKSKTALSRHVEQIHSNETHYCTICNQRFKSRITLRRHLRVHSDEKKYICTYCSNEYKRREALKIHLNTHTGQRPFKCPFCNRTFSDSSNRRKHKLKDHPKELEEFERTYGKGKVLHLMDDSN